MWFWRAQRYIFFMFYKEKDCDPIRTHTLNLYIFDKFSRLFIFGAVLNPDSAIEPIRMNLIQAFSPLTKIWAWIPHPYGMGLKYIWLSALSGNGYVCYTPNHVPGMTINHIINRGRDHSAQCEALGKKASHFGGGL